MQVSFRRILILSICLSLAVANGFMPRHAHAMAKVGPAVSHEAHAGHDRAHHRDHAAMADGHTHDHGMSGSADHPATSDHDGKSSGLTDNCCVASCSAIALIFASIDLPRAPIEKAFVSSSQKSLVLAARTTDDPPPR